MLANLSDDMMGIILKSGLKVLENISESSKNSSKNNEYHGGTIIPQYNPQTYERPELPSVSLDLGESDFSNCGEVNINLTVNYYYR